MQLKIFTLGLILISFTAIQAQNIVLNYEGHQLSNGETILNIGSSDLSDMAIELDVINNTSSTMEISCIRYELDTITNSNLYMCWANCTVLPFGGTVSIAPGETVDLFGAHCNPNGGYGVERNLYVFYNENNPSDSMSFIATYSTTSMLLEDDEGEAMVFESKEFWGVPSDEIFYQIPSVRNITNNPIYVQVEQQIEVLADGAEISFEWGGFLYEDESPSESLLIEAQNYTETFISYYAAGATLGISHIKYIFFEEGNIENAQQINLVFNTTSVGISSVSQLIQHQAYPNPSQGNLKISYQLNEGLKNARIDIFDLQSRMVYNQELFNEKGLLEISLAQGSYFYRFVSVKGSSKAVKLILL